MSVLAKPLLYLALLSFVVGVVVAFTGPIMQIPAESFGRGCTNMALLAIGIAVLEKGTGHAGGGGGGGGGGMA